MEAPRGPIELADENGLVFGLEKTLAITYTCRTVTNSEGKRVRETAPTLTLKGRTLARRNTLRLLGLTLDDKLNWKEQEESVLVKGTTWIGQIKRLGRVYGGVPAKLMRRLYVAVVVPKLTYALEVWYTPPTLPPGAKRRRGSCRALRRMETLQQQALLTTLGTLRTSPSELLPLHANVLPMELQLKKTCQRAALRICTLPDTNPVA
ncbi:hypothetical protein DL96DRAFT_1468875, partial [Flagelloscypha sp. PMI_526]